MLKEKLYMEVAPIFGVQIFIIKETGLILDVQDKVLRLAYSRKLNEFEWCI